MLDLKRFLDALADENHPFRKGPDLEEGSALVYREEARVRAQADEGAKDRQIRFYFSRVNKN